jgi:hypothetical protein
MLLHSTPEVLPNGKTWKTVPLTDYLPQFFLDAEASHV